MVSWVIDGGTYAFYKPAWTESPCSPLLYIWDMRLRPCSFQFRGYYHALDTLSKVQVEVSKYKYWSFCEVRVSDSEVVRTWGSCVSCCWEATRLFVVLLLATTLIAQGPSAVLRPAISSNDTRVLSSIAVMILSNQHQFKFTWQHVLSAPQFQYVLIIEIWVKSALWFNRPTGEAPGPSSSLHSVLTKTFHWDRPIGWLINLDCSHHGWGRSCSCTCVKYLKH